MLRRDRSSKSSPNKYLSLSTNRIGLEIRWVSDDVFFGLKLDGIPHTRTRVISLFIDWAHVVEVGAHDANCRVK